jgi:hypothetical protein
MRKGRGKHLSVSFFARPLHGRSPTVSLFLLFFRISVLLLSYTIEDTLLKKKELKDVYHLISCFVPLNCS